MRKLLINKLLYLIIFAFALSAQAQSADVTAGDGAWRRYELGKGTFSVLLPGKPSEEFQSAPSSIGIPVDVYIYSVSTEKGAFVSQYSLLGAEAEKWLESTREAYYGGIWDGIIDGFNKQMEESNLPARVVLVEKRRVKFSGFDGRELTFTVGALKGQLLLTLVERHGFLAMVMGPEALTQADRQRFLNSFTIKLSSARPAPR